VRSRVFYLLHRFIKECKNEISADLTVTLINGIQDLLTIQVEILELEDTDRLNILTEAVNSPGGFDSQLYLYETVGILLSTLFKFSGQQKSLLLSVVKPLLEDLSSSLQLATKGPTDVRPILRIHHIIMALGNIAKGFPDYPTPLTEGYILPPLDVFGEIAQAILVCLEAMNIFKVVRDAVCFFPMNKVIIC
jgi:exportin-T